MFRLPVIFFGGSVTHPPAGDKTRPSIAAVSEECNKQTQLSLTECFSREILYKLQYKLHIPSPGHLVIRHQGCVWLVLYAFIGIDYTKNCFVCYAI